MNDFIIHGGFGPYGGTLRCLNYPFKNSFNIGDFWVPYIIKNLGKGRYDIGSFTTTGNHIVNPCFLRNMLSEHVHHLIHGLNTIKGRTTAFGRSCSMRRFPIKSKFSRFISQGRARVCIIITAWVPM